MNFSFKSIFLFFAVSAILLAGSGTLVQNTYATDPTFTAQHMNSTATQIQFDQNVNGTLATQDWTIKLTSTGVAGVTTSDIAILNITNGTLPNSQDKINSQLIDVNSFGFLNASKVITLIHAAIPTDATYYINYTGNPVGYATVHEGQFQEAHVLGLDTTAANTEKAQIGFNATASDWMGPEIVSAKKTGPKKIEVLMSETVVNINSTGVDFTLYGLHDSVVSSVIASNSTSIIYLTTQNIINPINSTPSITLSYTTTTSSSEWITDGLNTERYGSYGALSSATDYLYGNRLLNFTGLSVAYPTDFTTDTQRYAPHIHDEVSVSVNSDKKYDLKIHDDITSNILARVGDTISVTVSIGDDTYLDQISKAILITNYAHRPSDMNQYYSTNHDEMGQTGLSVYEWNQNTFDQNYDYAGVISWDEAIVKIDKRIETYHELVGPLLYDENELFITYSMSFDDVMPKSQVGIKISDANYNNFESFLPFTLEVLLSDEITISKSIEETPENDSNSPKSELLEITLVTNNDSYENGDKVIVTGQIKNYDFNSMKGKDILYSIISPKNVVLSSGHIGPNSDGSFYFTTFAMDTLWKTDGNYIFSVDLRSLKQTIDIYYDNTNFESSTFESEPEATTATPIIPEATTATPIIPEATTATPIIPEATTATPIIPEATTPLSNSNIMCGAGTEDVNGVCQVAKTEINNSSKGGGCLIATAAYGSEMSPQVQLLREIRDNQLMNTESGSAFMGAFNEMYYSFSPTIADMQRDSPIFKEIVKVGLTPMLSSLSIMENANSESEVLGLGLSVIMLNIVMYLGVPAVVIFGIRKKF